jgi:ABC-type nickel/cobalt efflux system permease component RcnA
VLLLGAAGGLLPSPSAFLVLTTGLFTGRTAFALLLVVAFSIGLAATLTVLGLAVVRGRARLLRRLERPGVRRLAATLPLGGALAVLVAGLALLARGALQLG